MDNNVTYGIRKASAGRISKAYTNARRNRFYNANVSEDLGSGGLCNNHVALSSSATKNTIVLCILGKLNGPEGSFRNGVGDTAITASLLSFLTGTSTFQPLRGVVFDEDDGVTVESVERLDVDTYELTDMYLSYAATKKILMAWPKKHLQMMYKMCDWNKMFSE